MTQLPPQAFRPDKAVVSIPPRYLEVADMQIQHPHSSRQVVRVTLPVTVNPRFPLWPTLWLAVCLHEPWMKGATGRLITMLNSGFTQVSQE